MCDVVISLARLGVDLLLINIMIPYSMGDVKSFLTISLLMIRDTHCQNQDLQDYRMGRIVELP